MRLGVITDEVSQDFEEDLQFAKILGADKIRCFNFFRDSRVTKEMVEKA